MAKLTGKRALVLGGSRGIGAAIVERLTAEGAETTFTYAGSAAAAEALAEKTGAEAVQAHVHHRLGDRGRIERLALLLVDAVDVADVGVIEGEEDLYFVEFQRSSVFTAASASSSARRSASWASSWWRGCSHS